MTQDQAIEELSRTAHELGQIRNRLTDLLGEAARDHNVRGSSSLATECDEVGLVVQRQELCQLAKNEYAQRSRRLKLLDEDLFGEPAWDMLLDLYVAAVEDRKISVTSACIAARVPSTTALRWMKVLETKRLVKRTTDMTDARRNWVNLTDEGCHYMDQLLSERL